jgi:hypothetical protein
MDDVVLHICVIDEPARGSNLINLRYNRDFTNLAEAAIALIECKQKYPNLRIIVRLIDHGVVIPMAVLK